MQLCTLPWLGFAPDDIWSVPQAAVLRLADQLKVFPGVLGQYGRRAQTRSDHLKLVLRYLDWKPVPTGGEPLKDLEQFLLGRAMEHDTPSLLFHQAAEFLVSAHVIRPGVVTLMEMVATARTGAGALTLERVGHLLTGQMRGDLDLLLVHDAGLGVTRLTWLTTPAVEATSAAVKTAIEKLRLLRGLDAHQLDPSMLPRERRRFLATLGRRSTAQGLERRGERRYPILLALVAQSAVDQLDEVIALFDQAVSARESRAKARTDEVLAERARKGEARQLLMDVILPVLVDVGIPDENVGGILRTRIGMDRLREVAAANWKPLPRDHGRLAALEASYSYLRQFTPHVLNAIDFQGGPGTGDLMEAVEILKDLNRAGGRKVSFVPARYADYLARARKSGDETALRHYWEMCTVLALRDGLRSGDVFVPGSRRYADPGTSLFTPEQWLLEPAAEPSASRRAAPGVLDVRLAVGRGQFPALGVDCLDGDLVAEIAELAEVVTDLPGTVPLFVVVAGAEVRGVPDELLSYIAPGHRENINFFGFISVDIEAELAKLIEGWRPLRSVAVSSPR